MRKYIAGVILLLLSAFSATMVFGCVHDAEVALEPHVTMLWLAFLHGLVAVLGLMAGVLLLVRREAFPVAYTLWTGVCAVMVCVQVGGVYSFGGNDAMPAVLFAIPYLALAVWPASLASDRPILKSVGYVWPLAFTATVIVSCLLHAAISPAAHQVLHRSDGRALLELWMPQEMIFYLRPWSVAIALVVWAGMVLHALRNGAVPKEQTSE